MHYIKKRERTAWSAQSVLSAQDQQELFIRRKYQERAFLGRSPLDPWQLSEALHEAIKSKDAFGMLRAIVHNVDVNREVLERERAWASERI